MNELDKKIINLVNKSNYEKGKLINKKNILNQKKITIFGDDKIYKYKVESANNDNIYTVQIITKNKEIIGTTCTCKMYESTNSCKHVACVLINNSNELFPDIVKKEIKEITNFDISKTIINKLYNLNKSTLKNTLKLELEIKFVHYYYKDGVYISFKVGENKLYSANNKLAPFFNIYKKQTDCFTFGKDFTYDPSRQQFNEEDTLILDFLANEFFNSNYDTYVGLIFLSKNEFSKFIKLLKNKEFSIFPYYRFNGYLEENPFIGKIIKEDNKYKFSVEKIQENHFLDFYHEYLVKDDKLYKVPIDVNNLLNIFNEYNVNSVSFTKEDLVKFVKGMGNILNENIEIDENIKHEFLITTPKVELYFDFDDFVSCNIKFIYNDVSIFYNEINEQILRNDSFEKEVIEEVLNNNFIILGEKIILNDLDNYDDFINETLPLLNDKYTIFTTEKLDKVNIIKKTKIETHFTIGKDNIFKYDFNLDGIDKHEFDSIFNSISNNKKYYKLKNGNLLNLQDKSLNEFKNLINDMSLDIDDIDDTKEYVIPKYRAIYLDSLRKNKYSIIKTNNLFDEFIDNFNKYKNICVDVEDEILRNYQVLGVKWLYNIYKCGFGGILADEMGLGKSIQIIYLIKQILKEKSDSKILIVAPTSLIYNWENEFNKFGSNLKYKVFAGLKQNRKELFNDTNDINIFITTYGLLKEDKENYLNIDFEAMVIDEAQNIKNPKSEVAKTCKSIKSNIKFALTGTPIENSVIELWSIFEFIMPGYLGNLNNFQEKYNIKSVEKEELEQLKNLNLQISPFILRRKKEEVLKDLPSKIENNIFLDLNKEQKKIYIEEVKRTEKEMDEIIKTEGFLKSRFKILSLITKLRQICIDPKIVYSDYKYESIKMEEACNVVKKITSENHKMLIFTSYKKALEILKERLEKEKIKCFVIDGSVSSKKRNELVNSFNNDDTNVFLIMLKAGGTGLNLTGADTVIHLDLWWNPQTENQATDRAHRIGQKNTVQVIKFVCKGTIEERILELQNKKKILSATLIEGENRDENILSSLTEEDFRNLLSYSNE